MGIGKDYENTLRREADAAEPTKQHKRKHQLHSLWHASKVKVFTAIPWTQTLDCTLLPTALNPRLTAKQHKRKHQLHFLWHASQSKVLTAQPYSMH